MRFLWFGKKKEKTSAAEVSTPLPPVWSINNFVLVQSPLSNSVATDRSSSEIASFLSALVAPEAGPAELALVEFLQERGVNKHELSQFSMKSDGARSAKVADATLLLGSPELIARATMPFHHEITAAIAAGADRVFAIDALVYAAFSLELSEVN